jgi:hypothetical protein
MELTPGSTLVDRNYLKSVSKKLLVIMTSSVLEKKYIVEAEKK